MLHKSITIPISNLPSKSNDQVRESDDSVLAIINQSKSSSRNILYGKSKRRFSLLLFELK